MQANLWTRFCQTGKISDYLAWKQTAQTAEQPKKDTIEPCSQNDARFYRNGRQVMPADFWIF